MLFLQTDLHNISAHGCGTSHGNCCKSVLLQHAQGCRRARCSLMYPVVMIPTPIGLSVSNNMRLSCAHSRQNHLTAPDHMQGPTPAWLQQILDRAQLRAQNAWCAYERALDEKPFQAKALTSCLGLTIADVIAQAAEGGAYDAARTARMASFGLLWHGVSVRSSHHVASGLETLLMFPVA